MEDLTGQIIGAAIEVHRNLGPGLLESAYEQCLCVSYSFAAFCFDDKSSFQWNTKG